MNAAETIQAAIEKLASLRDEANVAPWSLYFRSGKNAAHGGIDSPGGYVSSPSLRAGNADLIVTLHATIDVQLAILNTAAPEWKRTNKTDSHDEPNHSWQAFELARAILGEQHDD